MFITSMQPDNIPCFRWSSGESRDGGGIEIFF